jgi:hypothetical protein
MSSVLVGWIVVIPISVAVGWLVWFIWNNNRKLDSRLAAGDFALLSSPSFKITEVIKAPAGSKVEKGIIQVVPPAATGYVRQELPDGRIALVPVTVVHKPIKSVHSTMHTNQQPPEM